MTFDIKTGYMVKCRFDTQCFMYFDEKLHSKYQVFSISKYISDVI